MSQYVYPIYIASNIRDMSKPLQIQRLGVIAKTWNSAIRYCVEQNALYDTMYHFPVMERKDDIHEPRPDFFTWLEPKITD